jgi:inositol phosphorylceramide mannosyltransferase catalytic subunit
MKIPQKIHQTWKNNHIPFHVYEKRWVDSWQENHPAWEHKLWTDADLCNLASLHCPEYKYILEQGSGAIKADFGRYLIMYFEGGIYVDLDYECFKDLTPLLQGKEIVLTYVDDGIEVSNAFLASIPRHPLFKKVIEECAKRFEMVDEVENITGPVMFTDVIKRLQCELHIVSSKLLSPISWRRNESIFYRTFTYDDTSRLKYFYPEAYAATYWTYHWRGEQKYHISSMNIRIRVRLLWLDICARLTTGRRYILQNIFIHVLKFIRSAKNRIF